MSQKLLDVLNESFGPAVLETHSEHGDETAVVHPDSWFKIAQFLRDDPRCDMQMMVDLCGVDFPNREPRFEVVMHLHSLRLGHRLRLKARVGSSDGEGAELDSVVRIWTGADWFERETYDLMGVMFKGHPDLRRILLYPEFVGHPLRKDYPADRIQPLVPFREGYEKLPPFDNTEGMSFGRQVFRSGKVD
ncbi:MAG TPA: NADH-quinone oxidoreductase subunit C [Polyangiaceae bacterium]